MAEITRNLKRDVRDLAGESAGLFTSFFKHGLCSVRAAADRWRIFTHRIYDAVDRFATFRAMNAQSEPMVTVVDGPLGSYRPGQQMTLSAANRLVEEEVRKQQTSNKAPHAVKITIDYVMDGKPDRYWLPIDLCRHGNLLEQMRGHLETYRTHPEKVSALFDSISVEYRQQYQTELTPFLTEHVNERSQDILQYFQRHCDIAALEQQLFKQAQVLPETEQSAFWDNAQKTISNLRLAANRARPNERAEQKKEPHGQPERQEQQPEAGRSRQSISIKLQRIQVEQSGKKCPGKARNPRQR